MGQYNFEKVQTFSFLGSATTDKNTNSEEVLTRRKEIKPSL